ncbi:MAG: hypothetical protein ABGX04_17765 [Myxococcales bacterium]|nr:hypothetical protein [Myxococcales bacterium]HIK86457.1 hypothetical protein [Myxococcales bacterium]
MTTAVIAVSEIALGGVSWPASWFGAVLVGPIILLGVLDMLQTKRAVLRNFPVIGYFRYLLEMLRPEIQQYFVESDIGGRPFNREGRSVVYQRAIRCTVYASIWHPA